MGVPTPQCLKKPRSQPSIGSNKEKKLPQAEREPRTKAEQKATPRQSTIEGRNLQQNSCEGRNSNVRQRVTRDRSKVPRGHHREQLLSPHSNAPPQVGMT